MPATAMLTTERLILRPFTAADLAPFAALNADPEVMRHFPALLTRAESDALVARFAARWLSEGICFAAAIRRADRAFLGMAGLARVSAGPIAGSVEIGWRFARSAWGQGYATESARAWAAHGFETLSLPEIVAFTTPANTRSQAVMRRLGMTRDAARDFDHPAIPPGHPLAPHVVYSITRPC